MKKLLLISALIFLAGIVFVLTTVKTNSIQPTNSESAKVRIEKIDDQYKLIKDGKIHYLKGVSGTFDLLKAKKAGANTIRTYNSDNLQMILDSAALLNMSVVVGLWIEPYTVHNDFSDEESIQQKLRYIQREINRYKNHPALLMWAIGNEIYTHPMPGTNTWKFINRASKTIHDLDTEHPVCTIIAGYPRRHMPFINYYCTDLDLLAFNSFGGVKDIQHKKSHWLWGYEGAFFISEWGNSGYWEHEKNVKGTPYEPESHEKAWMISFFDSEIKQMTNNLGQFAFYWGNYTEFTHTWWSMLNPLGTKTPEIDAVNKIYNGNFTKNECPKIESVIFNETEEHYDLKCAEKLNQITVKGSDPEKDSTYLMIQIFRENKKNKDFYSREDVPPNYDSLITKIGNSTFEFRTPKEKGNYRLFVHLLDANKNITSKSVPFYAE